MVRDVFPAAARLDVVIGDLVGAHLVGSHLGARSRPTATQQRRLKFHEKKEKKKKRKNSKLWCGACGVSSLKLAKTRTTKT